LRLGAEVRCDLPQGAQWMFHAAASGDLLRNPNPTDSLPLGGDNGLPGDPLPRQQRQAGATSGEDQGRFLAPRQRNKHLVA